MAKTPTADEMMLLAEKAQQAILERQGETVMGKYITELEVNKMYREMERRGIPSNEIEKILGSTQTCGGSSMPVQKGPISSYAVGIGVPGQLPQGPPVSPSLPRTATEVMLMQEMANETLKEKLSTLSEKEDFDTETLSNDINEDLAINTGDLATELTEQSSKFFYWSSQWQRADLKLRKMKLKRDTLRVNIDNSYRTSVSSGGRVTERMLDDYAYTSSAYVDLLKEIEEQTYLVGLLESAKDSFWQRNQALIALSKNEALTGAYADSTMEKMADDYRKRRMAKPQTKEKDED